MGEATIFMLQIGSRKLTRLFSGAVDRYEELQKRIPREEVEAIETFVLDHLKQLDPGETTCDPLSVAA